ncbi:phosphotransferase [Eisenbergiella sp.]
MYIKRLFIKTCKAAGSSNPYRTENLRECHFYRFLKEESLCGLPLPECYDFYSAEETGEFVIVLEDLSENYRAPEAEDLTDEALWFRCAESLAEFHAAFWNNSRIGYGELAPANEQQIERDICRNEKYLKDFLSTFGCKFSGRTIEIFKRALQINNVLIKDKNQDPSVTRCKTICNGDSHIYNFLISREDAARPKMIDFQFWGDGYGTEDLAHLTRVHFPDEFRTKIQIGLVRHYYDSLLKYGVKDYTWQNCFMDYRREIASMVLIPMWQYCCFGAGYEEWGEDIDKLTANYEYFNCDELCSGGSAAAMCQGRADTE